MQILNTTTNEEPAVCTGRQLQAECLHIQSGEYLLEYNLNACSNPILSLSLFKLILTRSCKGELIQVYLGPAVESLGHKNKPAPPVPWLLEQDLVLLCARTVVNLDLKYRYEVIVWLTAR